MQSSFLIKHIFIFTIWLVLSGCDPFSEPESLTDEYLTRLANILERDISINPITPPLAYPRPKQRRFELEPFTVNMLQFFSLFGCELQVLAGEKNSILGKVMTPTTRLNYEIRFLKAADTCLLKNKHDTQLQSVILDVIKHKQQQLPKVIWNAVWNSNEMAHFMSYSTQYHPLISENPQTDSQQLKRLNTQINKLLELDYSADISILDELNYQWQYESNAGQLLKTINLLTQRLNQANQLMAARLEQPICYQKKSNPKAERMKSFFFAIYIAKVQPYISIVHQQSKPLIEQLQQLASFTPAPSHSFNHYQEVMLSTGVASKWSRFTKLIEQHTKHWQNLLDQCGMRPMP